jgi:hypothetical protein, TIGR02147
MTDKISKSGCARGILQRELARRCESNPRYSLRAFAKALGISHPLLSLILSGRRKLSRKSAAKIAEKLSLSFEERRFFLSDYDFEETPSDDFQQIDMDTFSFISDWSHYAILSLLDIRGAKFEAEWIARRLGISVHESRAAMERLVHLGLVSKQGQTWKQTGLPIKVENELSTAASRKFQRQLLEKAIYSLENDPMEVRDMSSMTFAMDPELVPHALLRIRKFRRQLTAELEKMRPGKRVYNLTVQLYPVSTEGEKK